LRAAVPDCCERVEGGPARAENFDDVTTIAVVDAAARWTTNRKARSTRMPSSAL
jgi:hypothetical protein